MKKTTKPKAPEIDFTGKRNDFAELAGVHAFQRIETAFDYAVIERSAGSPASMCNAKIKGATKSVLVRVPPEFAERLEKEASGPISVSLVALAEYALENLVEMNKTLMINNKNR